VELLESLEITERLPSPGPGYYPAGIPGVRFLRSGYPNSGGIEIRKGVGAVDEVASQQELASAHGTLGIAHTRWATHGGSCQLPNTEVTLSGKNETHNFIWKNVRS